MLLRLCQLKSPALSSTVLLLTLTSCSWWRKDVDYEYRVTAESRWFKASEEHTIVNSDGTSPMHLFFDVNPEFSKKDPHANVVILNTANAPFAFDLDIVSGQRFFSHAYCKQKDIWGERSGTFDRPSFHVGFMPRSLDQLGEPQKVIVFGNDKYTPTINQNYFNVKIIGAYVEQRCPEGNCLGRNNWLSRLVFVAVDPKDYKAVNSIETFQTTFDWKEIQAQLENIDGRNGFEGRTYPSLRVGKLIPFNDAFDYFHKRSIQFSSEELKKIQGSCLALYDAFWKEVGDFREEEKPARTSKELSDKLKLREELKARNIIVGFSNRLRIFVKKYLKDMNTCEKFVYHGNINQNQEKFWFLSYLGMYFRLHEEGYFYDCRQKSWQKNYLVSDGKKAFTLRDEIDECSTESIDQAMTMLPSFLKGLKLNSPVYYSFVDYDNHPFGTHQKLYSWVKRKNVTFDCQKDPNAEFKKSFTTFPEDVQWRRREANDLDENSKLIY